MTEVFDIVIVGAGHAGAQAAIAVRQAGFSGSVALVGREAELPYERPPLSKDYLAGEKSWERLLIRPPAFWPERNITVMTAREVVGLDAQNKTVMTGDGRRVGYGQLIWAAGGDPRRLSCPGAELAGVYAIRSKADIDRLLVDLPGARNIVVIGGGYIGLEAAAVLRKMDRHVTVIEAQDRLLARVTGRAIAQFIANEHIRHGVTILTNTGVESLSGTAGRVSEVLLTDGTILPADLVIVGIGIVPAVGVLTAAGAEEACGGVLVDALCRTSLADVYAIGDCAAQTNPFAPDHRVVRVESVQNANDQATTAARAIAGTPRPHHATPWFWSNQYDLKLQTVGLLTDHDDAVVRGDPEERSFSVIYTRRERVIALDCVNMVRDYAQGRRLVEAQVKATPAQLANVATPLKDLLP